MTVDDEATNLYNYQQLLGAIATRRDDGVTTSRIFVLEPFSGQPRRTVDTSNHPSSSQIPPDGNDEHEAGGTEDEDLYWPDLYKAAVRGDWDSAKTFFHCHSADLVNPIVSEQLKMALHLAVGTGRSNHFVKKLLDYMQPSDLELKGENGDTALTIAATVGNLEAAKLLVNKNPCLPLIHVYHGGEIALPLHRAIQYNHKEMVLYLLEVMTRDGIQPSPYDGESGATILILLVLVGFYDVALDLLKKNPGMGSQVYVGETPLSILAVKPFDFPSGCGFSIWERLVYYCIPLKFDKFTKNRNRTDTENPAESTEVAALTSSYLRNCMRYVPRVKKIRETKVMHDQVLEIVRLLCTYAAGLDFSQAAALLRNPLFLAGKFGIPEIMEEIAEQLPHEIWRLDDERRGIFQLAVMNRREKVFKLLYRIRGHKYYMIQSLDIFGNNLLHLVGHLAPPHQHNLVSGAALQMQHELQWYKLLIIIDVSYHFHEAENLLPPTFRGMKNHEGKRSAAVFTEAHKDLVREGEKWMKDAANSCTVVAALIAVVFAAAITVPGGNADSGSPIFFSEKAFIIFAVSDALSLFSSTAAILMFLSILTARYAEGDFLYALPKRLIMGLLTLFISITSMMIAFSWTLYLVFGQDKAWTLTLVAGSACLLVGLFMYLHFPLLLVMINSTYGSGIFGKQSERPLF
ncbi:hypothetical protein DITRI_Ditri03aG0047400 [Diplodiscus trichospermus]